MNREEWNAMLDTEPVTPNQRGAIMGHFERLGFHPQRDRAERLAICAALLDLDALGSVAELTMGQAGQLVNALERIRDRAELRAVAAPGDDQDDDHGQDDETGGNEFMTWPEVITRILVIAWLASRARPASDDGLFAHCGCCGHSRDSGCGGRDCPCGESGNVAPDIRRLCAELGFPSYPAQGRTNSSA